MRMSPVLWKTPFLLSIFQDLLTEQQIFHWSPLSHLALSLHRCQGLAEPLPTLGSDAVPSRRMAGLQWTSSHVLGEPNAKCDKTLWGGNTGAWKMLGTWVHIDFILMFDVQSGNNFPVAIPLKTCTITQNKCQCLLFIHAAFWFT